MRAFSIMTVVAASIFGASVSAESLTETRMAAEKGAAEAQFKLGLFFFNGQSGLPKSYAESAKWFRAAAEQGHHEAQFSLGAAYLYGLGVPRDYVEAYKWATLAVAGAPDDVSRDSHLVTLDAIEAKITPSQRAEAQKLAREWRPRK